MFPSNGLLQKIKKPTNPESLIRVNKNRREKGVWVRGKKESVLKQAFGKEERKEKQESGKKWNDDVKCMPRLKQSTLSLGIPCLNCYTTTFFLAFFVLKV